MWIRIDLNEDLDPDPGQQNQQFYFKLSLKIRKKIILKSLPKPRD